jgi:hypothetical protein
VRSFSFVLENLEPPLTPRAMMRSDRNSKVPTSHPSMFGGRRVSTLRKRRDIRIRPNPMPPSRGYHRVAWELVCKISDNLRGTTPRIGSCSRLRESRTVTVTIADRQSRTNRSVPALKMGLLVTAFARVRYTWFRSAKADLGNMAPYQLVVEQYSAVRGG